MLQLASFGVNCSKIFLFIYLNQCIIYDLPLIMANKDSLLVKFAKERAATAKSILEFDFKQKRVRILSEAQHVKPGGKGVMYWMSREMRVQDNWSFLFAQKLALKNKVPLYVFFFLMPRFLEASRRHFNFLQKGLEEVAEECRQLDIPFHLYFGEAGEHLPEIVVKHNLGAVVCDFSPLRQPLAWQKAVLEKLPDEVPFCQVDGHNIVPVWEASDKQEYAARTIRKKLTLKLSTYLTPFPPLIKHPHTQQLPIKETDWNILFNKCDVEDKDDVTSTIPGYKAGIAMLESFCKERLRLFGLKRNDPNANALSNLSPWLHFGQIAPQRCILEVSTYKEQHLQSVNAYIEETVIRRELSDNFCFYNPNYDNIGGAACWAKITLFLHRKDKRAYVYTMEQFDKAETHDALWNSAQLELRKEGKIHGFMRMYWAKKILEWCESPERAIEIAIYLNDHYSLDGRDPNGYVGILWSICGIHDQGWAERPIFGKVRFMNFEGCKRKFKIDEYIARWGGKEHFAPGKTKMPAKNATLKRKRKTK